MKKVPRIVIVGNGFGGIYTLKHLHRKMKSKSEAEIRLVGPKNYFLFTPLLHEVATGGINQSNVVEPVRKILGCCLEDFHLGAVDFINTKERYVRANGEKIPFDYLVLATGASANFYGIPGAEENSLTLKSAQDAVRIKNHIISKIERAARVADPETRKRMLCFAVVGGGPTGVELVAEISELVKDTFAKYYRPAIWNDISILIIEKGEELVPQFGPKIRRKSLDVLRKKGIEVMLRKSVEEVGKDYISVENKKIPAETVIWVAGIKPNLPEFDAEVERAPNGRLVVDKFFALPGRENIFAIGDMAYFEQNGKALPELAQVAEKEARALARNLLRLLRGKKQKAFAYKHTGSMLSLGQWMAAGEIKGFTFYGRLAWWLWRTVYLFKFISLRKKLLVAIDWTINLFLPRDISEL